MLNPTIREELGRLRQIELAREAERRARLATDTQAAPTRRETSVLLARLHRRTAAPRDGRRPGMLAG
jgi:hypothetical protein